MFVFLELSRGSCLATVTTSDNLDVCGGVPGFSDLAGVFIDDELSIILADSVLDPL